MTASGSSTEKVKVAVVSVVVEPSAGPPLRVTTGGVISPISQPYVAGVGSTFRATPTAWTSKSCAPTVRPLYVTGEVQTLNGALSSAHWKVLPAWSAEKVN